MFQSVEIRGFCCRVTALVLPAVAAALLLIGCGGENDDPRAEDRAAIGELVERINSAVSTGDAAAWCAVFSPESVTETFGSPARCRSETGAVIKGQDSGRRLEVDGIAFDGDDAARVSFTGTAGEANLSRIDGEWYLDLLQAADADPLPGDERAGAEGS